MLVELSVDRPREPSPASRPHMRANRTEMMKPSPSASELEYELQEESNNLFLEPSLLPRSSKCAFLFATSSFLFQTYVTYSEALKQPTADKQARMSVLVINYSFVVVCKKG